MRPGLVAVLCLVALTACTDSKSETGPLAVVEGDRGDDIEVGLRGNLIITDECVLAETRNGTEVLLIFREGQIEWDSEERQLDVDGVSFADGASVALGGSESRSDKWVKRPEPSCLRDQVFEVHSVRDG